MNANGRWPAAHSRASPRAAGQLLVVIDGTQITEFSGEDGPIAGTVLITSEPQSIMAAGHALDPNRATHSVTLLRGPSPAEQQMIEAELQHQQAQSQQLQQAPPPQPSAPPPQPSAGSIGSTANPLEHYPWATEIDTPAGIDGAGGKGGSGGIKTKYNLPYGTALPPMQQIVKSHEATMRKTMFSGR